MTAKTKIQLATAVVSLLLLLLYTFWHTGGLLSRYIHPPLFGYVAAAGVELSVVYLSLQIGDMRHKRQDPAFFVGVLVAVVAISALANVAEGYHTRYAEDLTMDTVGNIDLLQAIFGLAATGMLSLVVFASAEIIGRDVTAATPANAATPPDIADDTARLLAFYGHQPMASQAAAAQHVGKSRQWVGKQLALLTEQGIISRNGHGVAILEREGG